jgi:YidC/Oxa1 family membrane protein insertase
MDENLNKEAAAVAYTADVTELNVDGSPKTVTLTQKLSNLSVTKKLTFYDDGHYDATISLSEDKRYFVYLG